MQITESFLSILLMLSLWLLWLLLLPRADPSGGSALVAESVSIECVCGN